MLLHFSPTLTGQGFEVLFSRSSAELDLRHAIFSAKYCYLIADNEVVIRKQVFHGDR